MKFGNGCWLMREGVQCFSPAEAYFVTVNERELNICAPTHPVSDRASAMDGPNLTIRITAPAPEVFRIQCCHYAGVQKTAPAFSLSLCDQLLDVTEDDEKILLRNGSLTLQISKNPWSMVFLRDGKVMTKSLSRDLAYMRTDWTSAAYDRDPSGKAYMREQLGLSVGEQVYGLGERFSAFAKNGQSVDIWNEDGGTSTEQSYKNIPFYLTNRGYGVFVNYPGRVSFEVASENVAKVEFSVPGESLDYFVINGPSMKQVLMRYTDLTGKPSLPPAWTFGLWLSTSFTTDYDEETVMRFIDGMQQRGIPLRVFHFDCFWMKEFHWTDFVWDERVFPDPAGMLKRIKDKGLKICVWINPYIAQESRLFKEGMENGYLLKRENGDVWQWDMWQPGLALVDFTNPAARAWYQDQLAALLDMGVDCFKTDFGERIPTNAVYYDGADPEKMHNYYTYLYNKTVFELLEKKRGKGEAVLFARSATTGCQQFPVHWGGDCWSDYEAMEQSLRGGLSLTMSGFGYWSHDIGGFESTSTADVYKRWAAFGLFSTHSRLHGSNSYRVPWVYDEEAVDVVRRFTRLKYSLMPYLYRNAIETSRTGVPIMRSMVLEYTEDRNCANLDKQYFFGDSLLVAPIFNDQSRAEFYLPEGSWTHFLSGKVYEGGRWYEEFCDYLSIPVFAKENSLIAVGENEEMPDYDYTESLTIRAYAIQDKAKVSTVVYLTDASIGAELKLEKNDKSIRIKSKTDKPFTLMFVNLILREEEGIRTEGNDSYVTISEPDRTVTIQ